MAGFITRHKRLIRAVILVLCVPVAAAVLKLLIEKVGASGDAAALQQELGHARSEGMATTWQEYAASIRPAKLPENAARVYQQLSRLKMSLQDSTKLEADLLFRRSSDHLTAARELLSEHSEELSLADQAARLPKCWFNRTWRPGLVVASPELSAMKVAAKFVGIRGSLAAVEHREPDALKSIHELFRIARHAEQEGTAISNAVSEAIFTTGIRHLAVWAFLYRDQPAYRRAMKEAISAWPSVKMQEMHRGDLVEILQVVDMSTSAEGRQALGLKSDQVPASELFMPLITFRAKAKVRIAAAERRIWEAYGAPPGKRLPDLKVATDELSDALSAYPSGKLAYFSISQDAVNSPIVDQVWESRRLCFAAIYRALAGKTIATTIETKDLKSPFDGKPVQYRFDGRQMTITVSSPNDKINLPPLSFPNEMELGRVGKRKA